MSTTKGDEKQDATKNKNIFIHKKFFLEYNPIPSSWQSLKRAEFQNQNQARPFFAKWGVFYIFSELFSGL